MSLERALSAGKLAPETVRSYVSKVEGAVRATGSASFAAMARAPAPSAAALLRAYPAAGTLKQTLTAILAAMRATGAAPGKLGEWRKHHAAASRRAAAGYDGVMSADTAARYVCWSAIRVAARKSAVKHATLQESMDACLLALVTELPPKRADFGDLRVTARDAGKGNRLVLPPGSGAATLVLSEYKTAKSFGVLREKCSARLTAVLRASLRKHPRSHVFVGASGGPLAPSTFGKYVQEAMTRAVGKPVGPTLLRHIYISDVVAKAPEATRKAIAASMLHSVQEQARYVLTRPGGRAACRGR